MRCAVTSRTHHTITSYKIPEEIMTDKFNYDAVTLAQKLIQFDTTNGVKPEKDCILFIKEILDEAGMETWLISNDEERPNLFAKLPAKNPDPAIPPFVMYGHIDVVPTDDQVWEKDPFAGIIEDGYLWGRGAIDMKGEHGMMLDALLKIIKETKEGSLDLPFDIYYIAVSDEEGMSDYGMKYLVENHPEQFEGMKYAIGEIGGFSLKIMGKKLYPIQIGEKQVAEIKITAKGEGGHASMKHSGTAMERLAEAIAKLSKKRLPVRIAPPVRYMLEEMSKSFGGVIGMGIKLLLKPALTDKLLDLLLGGSLGGAFFRLLVRIVRILFNSSVLCSFRCVRGFDCGSVFGGDSFRGVGIFGRLLRRLFFFLLRSLFRSLLGSCLDSFPGLLFDSFLSAFCFALGFLYSLFRGGSSSIAAIFLAAARENSGSHDGNEQICYKPSFHKHDLRMNVKCFNYEL